MRPLIHTIGHSTHPIEHFIELLQAHDVNCIVDVRSIAASRFNPQYTKKALEDALKKKGIRYLHFADEFGARRTDPNDLTEGKVDFAKVRASAIFKKGIQRLKQGTTKGFRIALMCAESEPLECHRFAMISPALKKEFEIKHILKDASIAEQEELETRLLEKYRKKLNSLFPDQTTSNRLQLALQLLNEKMGFINF
jgi:uncharacterized protein (DUF488 family)